MNPDYESVQIAAKRIGPFINHTPVITSEKLDNIAGCSLFFKCENLQKAGVPLMQSCHLAHQHWRGVLQLIRQETTVQRLPELLA